MHPSLERNYQKQMILKELIKAAVSKYFEFSPKEKFPRCDLINIVASELGMNVSNPLKIAIKYYLNEIDVFAVAMDGKFHFKNIKLKSVQSALPKDHHQSAQ
jgi:hypothetical protein